MYLMNNKALKKLKLSNIKKVCFKSDNQYVVKTFKECDV